MDLEAVNAGSSWGSSTSSVTHAQLALGSAPASSSQPTSLPLLLLPLLPLLLLSPQASCCGMRDGAHGLEARASKRTALDPDPDPDTPDAVLVAASAATPDPGPDPGATPSHEGNSANERTSVYPSGKSTHSTSRSSVAHHGRPDRQHDLDPDPDPDSDHDLDSAKLLASSAPSASRLDRRSGTSTACTRTCPSCAEAR